jgi:hypothetical protein
MRPLIKDWLDCTLMPSIKSLAPTAAILAGLWLATPSDAGTSSSEAARPLMLPPHAVAKSSAHRAQGDGGVLAGTTSQRWPAMFELVADGRMIKRAVIGVELKCSDGGTVPLPDPWLFVPVKRNGTFRATFHDTISDEGQTLEISDSLSGRFNRTRSRVSATLRTRMTFSSGVPGDPPVSCDSGNVKLRARD